MKVSFELDATWSHLLFAIIELVTIVESSILFSIYRNLLTQGVTKLTQEETLDIFSTIDDIKMVMVQLNSQ